MTQRVRHEDRLDEEQPRPAVLVLYTIRRRDVITAVDLTGNSVRAILKLLFWQRVKNIYKIHSLRKPKSNLLSNSAA